MTEVRKELFRAHAQMMCWIVRIGNCLVWSAILPLGAVPSARLYTVENYDVSIQVDLANQRLNGEVKIRLHGQADADISALELDAGALRITSVTEGQASQYFERNHGMLFVALAKPLRQDDPRTITIRYQAGAAPGLKFFPDQIYTSVTSDWMPCNDHPGERATLHLIIAAPQNMNAAASGQLTATRAGDGQSITEWQLDTPADPSWFGFALGSFTESTSDSEGVKLRVLTSTQVATAKQIAPGKQIMDDTAAAMHYLAERTGKRYPGQTYTQVFTHGDAIRAMAAGLTLLPESYAEGLAKQPDDLWLLMNELAHQWYGVGIAPKSWSDLWLSEGVTAFLADAYLGQRFGKERYEREIAHSRQIYNQLRAEGKDRPLSDSGWTTHQEADGEIPEHKGAWFLYLVNQLTGDNAFWNGLRLYTSDQWSQAAASKDFQSAFDAVDAGNQSADKNKKGDAPGRRGNAKSAQKTNQKPLDNLFDMWVYGIPGTDSGSKSK